MLLLVVSTPAETRIDIMYKIAFQMSKQKLSSESIYLNNNESSIINNNNNSNNNNLNQNDVISREGLNSFYI
jgi:hypothetical protein